VKKVRNKNMMKPATKPAVIVETAAKPSKSVLKAVYFGLDERLLLNVTAIVIKHCVNAEHGTWSLPADDLLRAKIFGDPIPNVLKKVYVKALQADGMSFSETEILSSDTPRFDYLDGELSFELSA